MKGEILMTDITKIDTQMVFLGALTKESKKTGNNYTVAKFCHDETQDVYEFFVMNSAIAEKLEKVPKYVPSAITLKMSSFQGNTRVDLHDVIIKAGVKNEVSSGK